MTSREFQALRTRLGKTQEQMSRLLGVSRKAVESYEQGWRRIPANIERIAYFLLFKVHGDLFPKKTACWTSKKCPPAIRSQCVAWVAREGFFCWFLTGKSCLRQKHTGGRRQENCFDCDFFLGNLRKTGLKRD